MSVTTIQYYKNEYWAKHKNNNEIIIPNCSELLQFSQNYMGYFRTTKYKFVIRMQRSAF